MAASDLLVVITALLAATVLMLLAWVLWLWRSRALALKQKSNKEAGKSMKNLIYQVAYIMDPGGAQSARSTKSIAECKEMAFVVTDIEGSTQLSVAGRDVYDQLLAMHDQMMREAIAKYQGTQIVTEGDSFLVAFHTVAEAVAFCQELQFKLLDTPWPKAVLKLPGCQPVHDSDGIVVMQGPRVRMGVHWAMPGLVACRPHALTKAPMMVGIAVSIAQEISDAAHGGQVLLSQEAWNHLRGDGQMARAGFPIVRQLGMFQLSAEDSKPSWLYSITETLTRSEIRTFPPPRKLMQIWPPPGVPMADDWGLFVTEPPCTPGDGGMALAFVALRLSLPPGKRRRLNRSAGGDGRAGHQHLQVPNTFLLLLQRLFVKQAQQFQGYLFGSDALTECHGKFSFAFGSTSNALRFCHTVQVGLMYQHWPSEYADYCSQTVVGIDGRLVFKGPRIAAAIHRSSDYDITPLASSHPTAAHGADYSGPAVELAQVLASAAHGGQVVMTEEAWQGVQDVLQAFPSATYSINLGLHVVADQFPRPRYLMEVMPTLLAGRSFKRASTKQQLELGYRDAPGVHEPMAMVFVKVAKPHAVSRAEASTGNDDVADDQLLEVITAYQLAVGMYAGLARSLMPAYGGYECKEPEPGKFTLAFGSLLDAVAWCCHVQKELLQVQWPPVLLAMPGCEEERGSRGQRLWGGLRVRMGMAYGYINVKKPMHTGRADYFGALANTAARVAAIAAPGQVLVECSDVPVTLPDGSPLLSEDASSLMPVTWAAVRRSSDQALSIQGPRRPGIDAGTDGGAPPSSRLGSFGGMYSSHAPRRAPRARRASYSSPTTDAGFVQRIPLAQSMPFQRLARRGMTSPMEMPAYVMSASKRHISLMDVTARSLSLGAHHLASLRRKSLTSPNDQGANGGAAVQQEESVELRPLGKFILRGLDNPKVLYQALPESLLERQYPTASEALISAPNLLPAQPTTVKRSGWLLLLARRGTATPPGGGSGGGSDAAVSLPHGAGARRRPSTLLQRIKASNPSVCTTATQGSGSPATTEGGLAALKASLRHASDLAAARMLSGVMHHTRHHSTLSTLRQIQNESNSGSVRRHFAPSASMAYRHEEETPVHSGVMRRSVTTPRGSATASLTDLASIHQDLASIHQNSSQMLRHKLEATGVARSHGGGGLHAGIMSSPELQALQEGAEEQECGSPKQPHTGWAAAAAAAAARLSVARSSPAGSGGGNAAAAELGPSSSGAGGEGSGRTRRRLSQGFDMVAGEVPQAPRPTEEGMAGPGPPLHQPASGGFTGGAVSSMVTPVDTLIVLAQEHPSSTASEDLPVSPRSSGPATAAAAAVQHEVSLPPGLHAGMVSAVRQRSMGTSHTNSPLRPRHQPSPLGSGSSHGSFSAIQQQQRLPQATAGSNLGPHGALRIGSVTAAGVAATAAAAASPQGLFRWSGGIPEIQPAGSPASITIVMDQPSSAPGSGAGTGTGAGDVYGQFNLDSEGSTPPSGDITLYPMGMQTMQQTAQHGHLAEGTNNHHEHPLLQMTDALGSQGTSHHRPNASLAMLQYTGSMPTEAMGQSAAMAPVPPRKAKTSKGPSLRRLLGVLASWTRKNLGAGAVASPTKRTSCPPQLLHKGTWNDDAAGSGPSTPRAGQGASNTGERLDDYGDKLAAAAGVVDSIASPRVDPLTANELPDRHATAAATQAQLRVQAVLRAAVGREEGADDCNGEASASPSGNSPFVGRGSLTRRLYLARAARSLQHHHGSSDTEGSGHSAGTRGARTAAGGIAVLPNIMAMETKSQFSGSPGSTASAGKAPAAVSPKHQDSPSGGRFAVWHRLVSSRSRGRGRRASCCPDVENALATSPPHVMRRNGRHAASVTLKTSARLAGGTPHSGAASGSIATQEGPGSAPMPATARSHHAIMLSRAAARSLGGAGPGHSAMDSPGSGQQHHSPQRSTRNSSARHSSSSATSSMYSGTASPRITHSGADYHGVAAVGRVMLSRLLGGTMGGRWSPATAAQASASSAAAHQRRRSAHIVLSNEATRLELMQRSAANTPSSMRGHPDSGPTNTFAAEVALTYLQHRRQNQQLMHGRQMLASSLAANAEGIASPEQGSPGRGNSFSPYTYGVHAAASVSAAPHMSRHGSFFSASQIMLGPGGYGVGSYAPSGLHVAGMGAGIGVSSPKAPAVSLAGTADANLPHSLLASMSMQHPDLTTGPDGAPLAAPPSPRSKFARGSSHDSLLLGGQSSSTAPATYASSAAHGSGGDGASGRMLMPTLMPSVPASSPFVGGQPAAYAVAGASVGSQDPPVLPPAGQFSPLQRASDFQAVSASSSMAHSLTSQGLELSPLTLSMHAAAAAAVQRLLPSSSGGSNRGMAAIGSLTSRREISIPLPPFGSGTPGSLQPRPSVTNYDGRQLATASQSGATPYLSRTNSHASHGGMAVTAAVAVPSNEGPPVTDSSAFASATHSAAAAVGASIGGFGSPPSAWRTSFTSSGLPPSSPSTLKDGPGLSTRAPLQDTGSMGRGYAASHSGGSCTAVAAAAHQPQQLGTVEPFGGYGSYRAQHQPQQQLNLGASAATAPGASGQLFMLHSNLPLMSSGSGSHQSLHTGSGMAVGSVPGQGRSSNVGSLLSGARGTGMGGPHVPRIAEPTLPRPSHPHIFFNAPLEQWNMPDAVAAASASTSSAQPNGTPNTGVPRQSERSIGAAALTLLAPAMGTLASRRAPTQTTIPKVSGSGESAAPGSRGAGTSSEVASSPRPSTSLWPLSGVGSGSGPVTQAVGSGSSGSAALPGVGASWSASGQSGEQGGLSASAGSLGQGPAGALPPRQMSPRRVAIPRLLHSANPLMSPSLLTPGALPAAPGGGSAGSSGAAAAPTSRATCSSLPLTFRDFVGQDVGGVSDGSNLIRNPTAPMELPPYHGAAGTPGPSQAQATDIPYRRTLHGHSQQQQQPGPVVPERFGSQRQLHLQPHPREVQELQGLLETANLELVARLARSQSLQEAHEIMRVLQKVRSSPVNRASPGPNPGAIARGTQQREPSHRVASGARISTASPQGMEFASEWSSQDHESHSRTASQRLVSSDITVVMQSSEPAQPSLATGGPSTLIIATASMDAAIEIVMASSAPALPPLEAAATALAAGPKATANAALPPAAAAHARSQPVDLESSAESLTIAVAGHGVAAAAEDAHGTFESAATLQSLPTLTLPHTGAASGSIGMRPHLEPTLPPPSLAEPLSPTGSGSANQSLNSSSTMAHLNRIQDSPTLSSRHGSGHPALTAYNAVAFTAPHGTFGSPLPSVDSSSAGVIGRMHASDSSGALLALGGSGNSAGSSPAHTVLQLKERLLRLSQAQHDAAAAGKGALRAPATLEAPAKVWAGEGGSERASSGGAAPVQQRPRVSSGPAATLLNAQTVHSPGEQAVGAGVLLPVAAQPEEEGPERSGQEREAEGEGGRDLLPERAAVTPSGMSRSSSSSSLPAGQEGDNGMAAPAPAGVAGQTHTEVMHAVAGADSQATALTSMPTISVTVPASRHMARSNNSSFGSRAAHMHELPRAGSGSSATSASTSAAASAAPSSRRLLQNSSFDFDRPSMASATTAFTDRSSAQSMTDRTSSQLMLHMRTLQSTSPPLTTAGMQGGMGGPSSPSGLQERISSPMQLQAMVELQHHFASSPHALLLLSPDSFGHSAAGGLEKVEEDEVLDACQQQEPEPLAHQSAQDSWELPEALVAGLPQRQQHSHAGGDDFGGAGPRADVIEGVRSSDGGGGSRTGRFTSPERKAVTPKHAQLPGPIMLGLKPRGMSDGSAGGGSAHGGAVEAGVWQKHGDDGVDGDSDGDGAYMGWRAALLRQRGTARQQSVDPLNPR